MTRAMADRAHSVPPPTAPNLAHDGPALVLALEAPRGWRRPRNGAEDRLEIGPRGLVVQHGPTMQAPLELSLAAVKVAAVDPGPAKVSGHVGRFAVLRRLGPTAVVPRTHGIEGWLWTSTGGTGLTVLGDVDDAPNVALVLAKPLGEVAVEAAFRPEFVSALAARSPLGSPTVSGLLFRVGDATGAERGLGRWGFEDVLTDREVPPTLRRHLLTDRPADPAITRAAGDPRAATSVAPPGF